MGYLVVIAIILFLIYGIVNGVDAINKYNAIKLEWNKKEKELKRKEQEADEKKAEMNLLIANLEKKDKYYNKKIENIDQIIKEKCSYYPQLAVILADLLTVHYAESAKILSNKKHPAYKEAERIQQLRIETKNHIKEKKLYEYKFEYLRNLFPDIEKYFDDGYDEYEISGTIEDNTDMVRHYISEEDYKNLTECERNQLALNNYINQRKSKWQIGRDYELYIGWLYSKKGYQIEYNGIIKRLEDMGRDIIATKNKETLIIQCKNWAKEKTIHENHIFQLYGSLVHAKIENPNAKIRGVFITSTNLSETAQNIADCLKIEIIQNFPLGDFPRIKCNINKKTGTKIYHLPFDQQYDKAKIENDGEFFAFTVLEAEKQGFRRAWKHSFLMD